MMVWYINGIREDVSADDDGTNIIVKFGDTVLLGIRKSDGQVLSQAGFSSGQSL